jgi:enamine deaminase RidA (YjgF/YER057c/UK114 family)
MTPIEARLADLGVTLPDAPAPAANYVPFVTVGTVVYVSGQISQDANGLIKGRLGDDMTVPEGAAAAQRCAISLLAQLRTKGDSSYKVHAALPPLYFCNIRPTFPGVFL